MTREALTHRLSGPLLPTSKHRWLLRSGWLLIICAGIVLKATQSPLFLFNQGVDDQLMVSMAHGLLQGHWSTSWQTTGYATMSKPIGYPLFLAAAHFLPWSQVLSAYLVYLAGALLLAQAWRRLSGRLWQATLILAMLVFNPVVFSLVNQRIDRDMLIAAMGTVAVGICARIAALLRDPPVLMTSIPTGKRHFQVQALQVVRSPQGRRVRILMLALTAGLTAGAVMITKPTWIWLAPAMAATVVYPVAQRLRPFRPWKLARAGLAALVLGLGVLGVTQASRAMDRRTYHVSLTEDIATGTLARAWKLWASVEAGPPPRPYIVISRAMRMAVYRVSPTAALMRPFLESPSDSWTQIDCASAVHICNDPGPWLDWNLMTAAAETGKVTSVADLQSFFGRVANDISRACRNGRLRCSSSVILATGLPMISRIPLGSVAQRTAAGAWDMIWNASTIQQPITPISTAPTPATYALWSSVIADMPSYHAVASRQDPTWSLSLLRIIGAGYRAVDLALLGLIGTGLLFRIREWLRRSTARLEPVAIWPALLFLLSALIGMGMLAVFAAAQYPLFVIPIYWTDFSPEAQLFLAFGLFAVWPVLAHWPRREGRHVRHQPVDRTTEPAVLVS